VSQSKLEKISTFWKVNLPDLSGKDEFAAADYIYTRLASEQYFHSTFQKLNEVEVGLLQFMTLNGGELACSEILRRMFAASTKDCDRVLGSLSDKGFLFLQLDGPIELHPGDTWVVFPDSLSRHIALPPHLSGFVGNLLRSLPEESLKSITRRMGHREEARLPHSELVAFLRSELLDSYSLQAFLSRLSLVENQMLKEIVERKGACLYRDLLDVSGGRKFDHSRAEDLNNLIQNTGIVFTVEEGHNKYMNSLMMPRDIFYMFTHRFQVDNRSLSEIEKAAGATREQATSNVLDNSRSILRDVALFAGKLDIQKARKLASGSISRTDVKKLAAIFPASKPFKYSLLIALYLIHSGNFMQVDEEWRASERLLTLLNNPDRTGIDFFRWWLMSTEWNELYVEGNVTSTDRPPQLWVDIVELRQEILKALSSTARKRWISFPSFWEMVSPRLEAALSRGAGGGGYGGIWSVRESVAVLVGESLYWLGLIIKSDVVTENSSTKSKKSGTGSRHAVQESAPPCTDFSFQLSPLGEALLDSPASSLGTFHVDDDGSTPEGLWPHHAKWLIIQPNHEIVAPPDLALDAIFNLGRMCQIRNVDIMATFEITRDSLRHVLEKGATGEQITDFLVEMGGPELPDTITQLISECCSKHGEVRIGSSGGYILSDDPMVIESIGRLPRIEPFVKERISPEMLILAESADVPKIVRELRNHGHLPKVETGSVHEGGDGRFHLSLTEPEMRDLIAAARFLSFVEKALDTDLSDGHASMLAQRLRPDSTGFLLSESGVEVRTKAIQKRFEEAFQRVTEEIADKYKNQVSRLVTKSLTSRGPSKYQYRGVNPAVERADIAELISFAHDYELEVELLYVKQNEKETRIVVSPRGIEGEKIFAHNSATDSDAMYSLPRILRARLL
jgi:hypothetical protein